MKRSLFLFSLFAMLLIVPLKPVLSFAVNNVPKTNSQYIILMDCESGRVIYERNSRKIVPMASTTKIMTTIVALENANLNDIVTISKRASTIQGSTIGMKYGEKFTMEQLLYGLMLRSGNDCAIAIAEHIAGSVEDFIVMMNSKAFDIGAFDTHFSTPHGLDRDGHFCTAYDLALITRYAFKNDMFSKIVSTKDITINGPNGERSFRNINRLLSSMNGADGVKTGFTGKAGKCLVSSASLDGKKMICVVLDSHNRWDDSKALLEYGLKNYTNEILIKKQEHVYQIPVISGENQSVKIGLDSDLHIPITDTEKGSIVLQKELPQNLSAPLIKSQQAGKLKIYIDEKEILSIPLKVLDNVQKSNSKKLIDRVKEILN